MLSDKRCGACGGIVEIDKTLGMGVCQYCGSKQSLTHEEQELLARQVKLESTQKKSEFGAQKKKKRTKIIIWCIVIFFALGAIGNIIESNTVNVTDVRMTTALDDSNNPVDEVVTFSPDAKNIIMTAVVNNPEEDTTVTVEWLYESKVFYTADKISVTPEKYHIISYITPEKGKQWDKGQYIVKIYLNDENTKNNWTYFSVY